MITELRELIWSKNHDQQNEYLMHKFKMDGQRRNEGNKFEFKFLIGTLQVSIDLRISWELYDLPCYENNDIDLGLVALNVFVSRIIYFGNS